MMQDNRITLHAIKTEIQTLLSLSVFICECVHTCPPRLQTLMTFTTPASRPPLHTKLPVCLSKTSTFYSQDAYLISSLHPHTHTHSFPHGGPRPRPLCRTTSVSCSSSNAAISHLKKHTGILLHNKSVRVRILIPCSHGRK